MDEQARSMTTEEERVVLETAVRSRMRSVPAIALFSLAGLSVVGSLGLFLMGRREAGILVGTWAPTFFLLGVVSRPSPRVSIL